MAQGDAQKVHRVLILGPTPKLVDQLMVRTDFASMVDQYLQKVILGRRQFDLFVSDEHLSPVEMHVEVACREGLALRTAEGPP